MIVRSNHPEWNKFYVNIHIRTLQPNIRIFKIVAYGKIGTDVECDIASLN